MDKLTDVANWRYRVLLEPRGFIRFLQFILSIVAFATTSGFSTTMTYQFKCDQKDAQEMEFPIAYPFRIDEHVETYIDCENKTQELQLEGDLSPTSQWFVSVGVLSFLLTLGSIVFYVAYESSFRLSHERIVTTADLVLTVLFAFFWLTAAASWAWGSNQVKYLTGFDYVGKLTPYQKSCSLDSKTTCRAEGELQSSKMSASVAFGFLNFFLWVCNVWFVYKESPFHPEPNKEITQEAPAAASPPQNTM